MKLSKEHCEILVYGSLAGLTVGLFLAALTSFNVLMGAEKIKWEVTFIILPLVLAVVGAIIPFIASPLLRSFKRLLTPLGITSVNIDIPGLGETKLELANPQREAARRIFLEMTTRTVTQRLKKEDGTLSAAIKSLYEFFQIVRGELKTMPPPPPGTDSDAKTLESIAHRMINQALRPYLSRWHDRINAWNETGLGETDWPLYEICRYDLDRMRSLSIQYAKTLGDAAGIPAQNVIVPEVPIEGVVNSEIDPIVKEEFLRIDFDLNSVCTPDQRKVAWKLAVEFSAFSAKINIDRENVVVVDDLIRSTQNLIDFLSWNLGTVAPTPGNMDLDEIGLRVLKELEGQKKQMLDQGDKITSVAIDWVKEKANEFEAISRKGINVEGPSDDCLENIRKKYLSSFRLDLDLTR